MLSLILADLSEHKVLELWANKFGFTATIGVIFTLLIAGKFFHHAFQRRGLVFGFLILPPAIISGIIGLCITSISVYVDATFTDEMLNGLSYVKSNLTSFVFASLVLGNSFTFHAYLLIGFILISSYIYYFDLCYCRFNLFAYIITTYYITWHRYINIT